MKRGPVELAEGGCFLHLVSSGPQLSPGVKERLKVLGVLPYLITGRGTTNCKVRDACLSLEMGAAAPHRPSPGWIWRPWGPQKGFHDVAVPVKCAALFVELPFANPMLEYTGASAPPREMAYPSASVPEGTSHVGKGRRWRWQQE